MKSVEIVYRYETGRQARPDPDDAAAAMRRLDDGNDAFAALLDSLGDSDTPTRRTIPVDARDLGLFGEEAAPEQRPFAAVLGCADARVPVELVFNEGPNDLFVVRVAGNLLGDDVLASLRYGIEHLGDSLKLIVVLGHGGCGAVTAAVDVFLDPSTYLPLASKHVLRGLVDRLLVVVHASSRALAAVWGEDVRLRSGYREALIELSVVVNAALGAYTVQQEIGLADAHGMRAAWGVFVLETRRIWTPGAGAPGLVEPPRDLQAFVALGAEAARARRIAGLLGGNAT